MPDAPPIRILFFAALRDTLGDGVPLDLPARATVAGVRAALRARGAPWHDALDLSRGVRAAVNQTLAGDDTAVAPGDEVAFFPPVTGG